MPVDTSDLRRRPSAPERTRRIRHRPAGMPADPLSAEPMIVGRDRELELIAGHHGAFVLTGSAGQGLTALLDAAAALAVKRGDTVLRASGVRAEQAFPYAGLQQLLRPLRRQFGTLSEASAA